jgi:hypothetical protein
MNGVSAREQLWPKLVFLNRGAAARYRALASFILGPRLKEEKINLPGHGLTKIENHWSKRGTVPLYSLKD